MLNARCSSVDAYLFLTISAVMSGAEGWSDIEDFGHDQLQWLRKYRKFENGIPVDDTIARIIRIIKPEELNKAFLDWVNTIRKDVGQPQIAIDGKTLRHSYDGEKTTALHSITAWSSSANLVLAQLKSEGKKNENASVLDLLDTLNIKGTVITVDAMNSQRKIAEKIIKSKGDYVLCIKDNQKKLKQEIAAYFHKVRRDTPEHIAQYKHTDAGHGRIEERSCSQLNINEWITEADKWSGIRSIAEIHRVRHLSNGKQTEETQYYISSLPVDPDKLSRFIRNHWEVENKTHWVLDVAFKEDDSRIRKDDGAENVGILRRFCLNMARLHPKKASMRRKIKMSGWNSEFRSELIFGIS